MRCCGITHFSCRNFFYGVTLIHLRCSNLLFRGSSPTLNLVNLGAKIANMPIAQDFKEGLLTSKKALEITIFA